MKKQILTAAAVAAFAWTTQASLILSNSFAYADGPITTVSAGSPLGVWTNHSGSGALEIVSEKAVINSSKGEDVCTPIPATSAGVLYASFTVNFSALPTTSGTYFWHFKDDGAFNYRARVFANATGAESGKFRIGIANGGSSYTNVLKDLDLNTDYKIVVRYNVDTRVATLWINPNSEDSTVDSATATDSASALTIMTVAMRQAIGEGTLSLDDLLVGTSFSDVAKVGGAPNISAISTQMIAANSSTGPIPFTILDVETPAADLQLAGYSDNTSLIPNNPANISFGGSGASRTVTITPAAGQQGTATVAVVVTDASSLTATSLVSVVVGAPTIAPVADQTTPAGTSFAPVAISVNDTETPNGLTVTATSSNPAIIQDSKLVIIGTGTNRTLQITPEAGQTGVSTITVTVSDGIQSAKTTFVAAVSPQLGVILNENFNYSDGLLSSGNPNWIVYSPAPPSNDCYVVSGKLTLSRTNNDDVHNFLANGATSFPPSSGAMLYSKFVLNYSSLPTASGGGYFAFFKDTGTSQFRARVFAETNGAAAGKFRLAISNGAFTEQRYPMDLSLGTDYTVVTRYNTVSGVATLWVNPRSESSQSVSGIDLATPVEIFTYAFRQDGKNGNIGVLSVDDLVIGTAFKDVLTELPPLTPIPLNIARSGDNIVLTWADPAFKLQSADSITGTWTTLDVASGYTTPATGTKFFRLIGQ